MKLYSPRFEKALRRKVKTAVRSSPVLEKEYRQAKKAVRKQFEGDWLMWSIISLASGALILAVVKLTGHPATGLAVINLITLMLAAHYAGRLPRILFRSADLGALSLLPLPESAIFWWQLQKFFLRTAVFSLVAMLASYAGLGLFLKLSFVQWIGTFTLAIVSWVTLLALAALMAARFPALPYLTFAPATVFMFGFGVAIARKTFGHRILQLIDQIAPVLNLVLPSGWCPSLFQVFLPEQQRLVAFLIIPIALIIWTLKSSLELLQNKFTYQEYIAPVIPDQIPGEDTDAPDENESSAQSMPVHLGPTAIEEIVQTRQFFLHEPWERRGWVERMLSQWLDEREKTLAEFAFPKGFFITRDWIALLRIFVITILVGFAAGLANIKFEFWIIGIGLFITSIGVLALIWGNGSAFRAIFDSGVRIPIYAAYPIGFRELSQLLLKVSVMQLPFLIAYVLICAVLICYLTGTSFGLGIIAGFKLGFLLFSARFITTTLAFSSCTNDTSGFRPRTIALVLIFLGAAGLFLAMGVGSLFVPSPGVAWALWVAAMADAYILQRIYGWFHSANVFDLMNFGRR